MSAATIETFPDLHRLCTRSMLEASGAVRALTEFAVGEGGACFKGWTFDKVFRYLAFHALSQHLAADLDAAGHVRGLMVAWPTSAAEIRRREAAGEPYWHWELPKPGGDAVMLAEVIAARGVTRAQRGQEKQIIGRLADAAMRRSPDWKSRKFFTWRHGRLHSLSWATITRFLYGRTFST